MEHPAGKLLAPFLCSVFIGRTSERDALCQIVDRARSGKGQIASVCGEAGIGKSRLVAEVAAYAAAQGFLILQGNCFQLDSTYPYAPLLDLLRAAVPQFPDSPEVGAVVAAFARFLPDLMPSLTAMSLTLPLSDPEQEKRRLFAALTHFFQEQSRQRPVVLVIEDLHWCDDASLEFLQTLARICATHPLLVLLTYRSDEMTAALRQCLARFDHARLCRELRLEPLTRQNVEAMLDAMLALPEGQRAALLELLYPLTEGNPFFVEEVLTSLNLRGDRVTSYESGVRVPRLPDHLGALAIPRSVQEAVRLRMARLSGEARRLMTLAAVSGQRFDVALLQEVLGYDDAQLVKLLKEVTAAQLVREEEADRFAFRHALTQQAIYTDMLARERRELHRSIAETLERLSASALPRERYLEDLSYHCYEAGMWEQALACSLEVGEKALAVYAQQAAIDQLTRALHAAHQLSRTPPARLLLLRGQAYESLGDFERARDDYEHARDAACTAQDGATEWQGLIALGFLWSGRDYEQAGAWFKQALALAEQLDMPHLRARSLNRLGNWLLNIGQIEQALPLHQEAFTLFETRDDMPGMAESLDLLAMAQGFRGDRVTALETQRRAITLFRALHDDLSLSSILATSVLQLTLEMSETSIHPLHAAEEALRDATEALRLAQKIGSLPAQAFAEITLSYAHGYGGDLGQALAHAHEALRIATAIEHRLWTVFATQAIADVNLALLQATPARAALDLGLALSRETNSEMMTEAQAAFMGLACLLGHDLPQAEAVLSAAMARDQQPQTLSGRHVSWVWGELSLAQGQPARALERAEALITSAPGDQRDQPIPHLLFLKGNALVALGRLDDAAQTFVEAQRGAEIRHDMSVLWRIHAAHGRLLSQRKCDRQARRETLAARRVIEALAASVNDLDLRERFLGAALAQLPDAKPISPRRDARRAYDGLTPREREVAALVAQGKSSREIADLLVVSTRTAEAHVGNILGKLGFSSRTQIAVWAVEHGLAERQPST